MYSRKKIRRDAAIRNLEMEERKQPTERGRLKKEKLYIFRDKARQARRQLLTLKPPF